MSTATATEDRAAWLANRVKSVGASEVAAVIGVSPWETPVEKWQEKTGRVTRDGGSEAMLWGSLLEPVILAEYERRTGTTVGLRQGVFTHPVYPFMTATIDGMTDRKLVEVKTASGFARGFGDEGGDGFPDHYRVQVHAQMACTGATEADLVVLVGGQELRVYPVVRDPGLVNAIEDRVGAFWRCVETDTPPTWGKLGPAELAAIFPGCEGEAEWDRDLAREVAEAVDRIESGKDAIASYERFIENDRIFVLKALGNARSGRLPDGRIVRRYLQEVAGGTRTVTTKPHTRHYFKVLKGGKDS